MDSWENSNYFWRETAVQIKERVGKILPASKHKIMTNIKQAVISLSWNCSKWIWHCVPPSNITFSAAMPDKLRNLCKSTMWNQNWALYLYHPPAPLQWLPKEQDKNSCEKPMLVCHPLQWLLPSGPGTKRFAPSQPRWYEEEEFVVMCSSHALVSSS